MEYTIYPFDGPWQSSELWAEADHLNSGLLTSTSGHLQESWQPLRIDADTAQLGCLKLDATSKRAILRIYESAGRMTPLHIDLPSGWINTGSTDLLEDSIDYNYPVSKHLDPFEIRTLALQTGRTDDN